MAKSKRIPKLPFARGMVVVYKGGSALSSLGERAGKKLVVTGQFVNRGRRYLALKTADDSPVVLSPERVRKVGGRRAKTMAKEHPRQARKAS